jgi:SAM-dependent methyltransferase
MIREMRALFSYHSQFTERQARHDCLNVFGKAMRDLGQVGFTNLTDKRVLDLGCGQRFPFALQCAAAGAEVTALDLDYVKPNVWPLAFAEIWKHNGPKRALKSMVRRVLFDRRYYAALEDAAEQPLRSFVPKISFVMADPQAASYPLPDKQFDLIASNAVVEHVADVELMASEIRRLLIGRGYFHAIIHNFYSLSGGHAPEWAYPDERPSNKVPPWDHLRENPFSSMVISQ